MFHQIVMILAKDCWVIKFIDQVISIMSMSIWELCYSLPVKLHRNNFIVHLLHNLAILSLSERILFQI